ncbi:transcriptional regulator, RinA family [Melissococcus plutonius]|uniref:Transcriptional regulator, RinA family n=1 Tax=Melissococcus plutonius (strain ATCC 35311 / DSM 29964 / CIP 104052 / LMG 20360 / NCIMB 702443) TaxID=940190 RepID=F3YBH7_MELPT|nr:transcriptional regulator [Melissococcus plutonius]AIM25017.1 transcriptional regulator, RinA family [Melissococcus plutonius S1]KMT23458.1 transcriptional regulator, RinA family [Melissococcus plutonius]KMT25216.1 transcriptional regulator, RinA family [Melissococcus plutonius]KMT26122.1 transcriptional regulator, RinA family [Melissococcus plutonius]KMT26852.1 transcriptional regulator, RinA family [Melissococcus plutonius]
MRTSTFNYIKDILADYYKTDEYIKKREEELRYPYKESDLNRDIQGKGTVSAPTERLMITIEQDKRLAQLERNKKVIDDTLDNSCKDTQIIIKELYMKKRQQYTLEGLVQNQLIFCSKRTAQRLRTNFFKEIASELGLEI